MKNFDQLKTKELENMLIGYTIINGPDVSIDVDMLSDSDSIKGLNFAKSLSKSPLKSKINVLNQLRNSRQDEDKKLYESISNSLAATPSSLNNGDYTSIISEIMKRKLLGQ